MDYNIYIHGDVSGTGESQTTPWKPSETTESGGFQSSKLAGKIIKGINVAQNPDGLVSQGMGAVAKALPWLAVAYAVLKLTDSAITTATAFYTTETGDYRFSTQYANFKAGVHAVLRPISTSINYARQAQQIRIDNQRKSASRELLGDDIINGGSFYGV